MNRNSPANNTPAISPAFSVPSLANSAMPRIRAQMTRSTVASTERRPPCITGDISAAASLIATLVKPHTKQHNTIVAKATESRGIRFTCRGATDENEQKSLLAAAQEQVRTLADVERAFGYTA